MYFNEINKKKKVLMLYVHWYKSYEIFSKI